MGITTSGEIIISFHQLQKSVPDIFLLTGKIIILTRES